MIELNGIFVYSKDAAIEALKSLGLDAMDIDDLCDILCGDKIEELENRYDDLEYEFKSYETTLDEYHACANEVMNYCNELLEMKRVPNARDALMNIKRTIYNTF